MMVSYVLLLRLEKTPLCRFGRITDDLGHVIRVEFPKWYDRLLVRRNTTNLRLIRSRFYTPLYSPGEQAMLDTRKALFCSLAFVMVSGCMTPNSDKSSISPTIIPMTAKPRSCEGLRETLLKIAPVGTPAQQATNWLESEGFTCHRTGANQQTIYATRTDQSSYWSSQRWMVVCTLDQEKVVEYTVTQGK